MGLDDIIVDHGFVESPTATPYPQPTIGDTMLLPIPGKIAARGDITHKPFNHMNRQERRAYLSSRR